jgi:hypothetical protein
LKFSQRVGITPIEKAIQIESIDIDLRSSLWSLLTIFYWDRFDKPKYDSLMCRADQIKGSNLDTLFTHMWLDYFKRPIDSIPKLFNDALPGLKKYFFKSKWYEVYDFIEFCVSYSIESQREKFTDACNSYLERENSGYRFIDLKIIEISSSEEVSEIKSALTNSSPYYGVKQHLSTAITLFSDKNSPDLRNSIKESISAVESLCKKISNDDKATLGVALKLLEKKGAIHPALKNAFSSLYGYTNDADGIRHSMIAKSKLTKADARFMIISCSAFINYVIANSSKK